MARQKASNNFTRLLHASKRRVGTGVRKPWRTRTIRPGVKLTAGQKAERRKKFAAQKKTYKEAIIHVHEQIKQMATEIHHQFDKKYSMDEIATDIFQSHRLRTATKDVGRYHAFVSMQSKIMNAGEYRCILKYLFLIAPPTETPEGEPKKKVNELSKEISKKWKAMSDEEKNSLTKDILVELRECRENKEVGEHKPGAVAAQDSFMTGERVQDTVRVAFYSSSAVLLTSSWKLKRLNMRTGDEALLIITSGSLERAHRPYVVTTGPRVDSFCTEVLKLIPDDIGAKMDGFMVTGIEGVARTHAQMLLDMKKTVSQLILQKLREYYLFSGLLNLTCCRRRMRRKQNQDQPHVLQWIHGADHKALWDCPQELAVGGV